ncbi:MAG: glutamate dehydrogenase, partial [Pseudomonadota bacterium]
GVLVSWLEWADGRAGGLLGPDEVQRRLTERLTDRARDVAAEAERHDGDLRRAAYALAARRLSDATLAAGAEAYGDAA